MSYPQLAADTPPEVEQLQIEGWRRMSPGTKANLVRSMTAAAIEMMVAGIRYRHPHETSELHRRRLAEILLGPDLAREVFAAQAK